MPISTKEKGTMIDVVKLFVRSCLFVYLTLKKVLRTDDFAVSGFSVT